MSSPTPAGGATPRSASGSQLDATAPSWTPIRRSPPPPSTINLGPERSNNVRGYQLESREDMMARHAMALQHGSGNSPITLMAPIPIGGAPMVQFEMPPMASSGVPPGMNSYQSAIPFDYILVLDFEATCDEPEPHDFDPEIIEFPVVLIETARRQIVAEFHSFVRPVRNPQLSAFCRRLTGISQEAVDLAPTLPDVILLFERWAAENIPQGARGIFATDGPWDLARFMYEHAVCRQGIRFPPMFYSFIDVKSVFSTFFGCGRCKIEGMLSALALKFEGRLHSGIDDARNIARIVVGLLGLHCDLTTGIQRVTTFDLAASSSTSSMDRLPRRRSKRDL